MQLALGSIYCPSDEDIERSITLFERSKTNFAHIPFIVGMDAYASSSLWHSEDLAESRNKEQGGDVLSEYLLRSDFVVVNSPSQYFTFAGLAGFSDIDLTVGGRCLDRVFDCCSSKAWS